MIAVDDGGFQVQMPRPAGVQRSTIYLNTEPVETHINILSDSGITYVASWFDLPPALADLPETLIPDTVWTILNTGKQVTIVKDKVPVNTTSANEREAWLLAEDGTRIGVRMVFRNKRVMIMNAGTPDGKFREREERNIVRFLASHKILE